MEMAEVALPDTPEPEVLNEKKRKLEGKYCVRISDDAFDLALQVRKTFGSELISDEILRGACKLVFEREVSEFYDKSYQLRWALVELIELYRDNHPDSQYWVDRLRLERDRASIFMYDFLNRWEFVVRSSAGFGILTRKCAEKLPIVVKENACPDVAQFLDDIHGQLIRRLGCLLTVEACHVAEVVSNLTDVPPTQILPSINDQKQQEAMHMMNQRLVNQEHVIREVLETLVSPKRRSNTLPRGSFLLLGPSGVGKTEIAKAVAEQWYCDASRLVEIDLSDYVEPAACDLSEWSNGKHEALWSRLTEVVAKRPYSVILMDKIDKASPSVTRVLLEVLSNEAPIDLDGNPADFSNSIIFMTSSVGSNQLALLCKCHNPNKDLWIQFVRNPLEFRKTHDCTLEGSGPGRALTEARCFFTDELLNSVDKVLVVERFRNYKAVFRLLLREIVRELTGQRFVVHASDAALNSLFGKSLNHYLEEGGKSFKQLLLEHVIPHLPAAEDLKNVVLYVDTLVGTRELSFRLEKLEPYVDDWYFKLKDGTFDKSITNLRIKLEAVRRILNARSLYLSLLDCKGHGNSSLLLQISVDICKEILMWSPPFPEQPPRDKGTSFGVLSNNLPTIEEVEKIKNRLTRLYEDDTGLAKATSVIVYAVLKIIAGAPLQLPDSPARHYLFLGLGDDSKVGLIDSLTESLRTGSGESLFTHIKLSNGCRGDEVKKLLIKEVKEKPCMVFMFDGVEFADALLFQSLLKICDKGTLDDSEGFQVDFRNTIVIVTSEAANKRRIAQLFNHKPCVSHNHKATDENVKRFRTELLHRVDEIILFDPLLPEHGSIYRLYKRHIRYMKTPHNFSLYRFLLELFAARPDQGFNGQGMLT